jgi:hypothetical protein
VKHKVLQCLTPFSHAGTRPEATPTTAPPLLSRTSLNAGESWPLRCCAAPVHHHRCRITRRAHRTSVMPAVKTKSWSEHQWAAVGHATLQAMRANINIGARSHAALAYGTGPQGRVWGQALAGRMPAKPGPRGRDSTKCAGIQINSFSNSSFNSNMFQTSKIPINLNICLKFMKPLMLGFCFCILCIKNMKLNCSI